MEIGVNSGWVGMEILYCIVLYCIVLFVFGRYTFIEHQHE